MQAAKALSAAMAIDAFAAQMRACGFDVRTWKNERLYVCGYGQAIKAWLTPALQPGAKPCDGAHLHVESTWRSAKAALHAKGVKHAMLEDLYKAGLLSAAPPARWQDVVLDERPRPRPIVSPAHGADS